MGAVEIVALVAACVALVAAGATIAASARIGRRTKELSALVEELHKEVLPLVRNARTVVDHAAIEMERVGDVLGSAEAVSATVDSASRLAYRAFSNPVVKTVAFGSGLNGAMKRLVSIRSNNHSNGNGKRT
jgi:exoribonuclease II